MVLCIQVHQKHLQFQVTIPSAMSDATFLPLNSIVFKVFKVFQNKKVFCTLRLFLSSTTVRYLFYKQLAYTCVTNKRRPYAYYFWQFFQKSL